MDDTLDKISNLYSGNLSEHGDQSKAVGWPTSDSQELRFEKLNQVIPEMADSFSVNDYGCGYGAHLEHLLQKKYSVAGYNGYDLSEEMLGKSKERLKNLNIDLKLIHSSKISTPADFTFVSGTFNVRFESTYEQWKKFIEETLNMINGASVRGFSFNLLSKYVDWEEPHLFYGDPCYWFDFCKKHFSSKVSLLHDYPLYEWTILVHK